MKKHLGFTLLELMVTVAILAILTMIAAPSFDNYIRRNAVQSESRNLRVDLSFARSEAVSRNSFITVCASSDGATCSGSNDWSDGWIVFVDNGEGGTSNQIGSIGLELAEEVLRVYQPSGRVTVMADDQSDVGVNGVLFDSRGYLSGLGRSTEIHDTDKLTFLLCDAKKEAPLARAVFVELTGRSLESADLDSDGVHEDLAGSALTCP